jgi:hypothetical protein
MKHLSEEQLILFHYDEAEERQAIEQHLTSCDLCRSRHQDLQRDLALFGAAPIPERPEDYGQRVWFRLRPRLMERPRFDWRSLFAPHRLALAGALASLLVVAFLAGRYSKPRPTESAAIPAQARERILLVAVGNHLERSQMVLVELVNTESKGPVDISAERNIARDLVDENRLYRQTAARAGEVGVASVLDDLERVLIEIANGPSKVSAPQLDDIRRRIEAKGIIFKIRVVGSQVQAREKSVAPRPPGGTI